MQRFIFSCSRGRPPGKCRDKWISQMVTWQLMLSVPHPAECSLVLEDELLSLAKVFFGWCINYIKSLVILTPFHPSYTSIVWKPVTAREDIEDRVIKLVRQDLIQGKEDWISAYSPNAGCKKRYIGDLWRVWDCWEWLDSERFQICDSSLKSSLQGLRHSLWCQAHVFM